MTHTKGLMDRTCSEAEAAAYDRIFEQVPEEKKMSQSTQLIEGEVGEIIDDEDLVVLAPAPDVGVDTIHAVVPVPAAGAIRPHQSGNPIRIETFADVQDAAKYYLGTGLFTDVKSVQQMEQKILVCLELGCFNYHGMREVNVIATVNQQTGAVTTSITLGYKLVGALLRRQGYDYRTLQWTNQICVVEFFRAKESLGTYEYTIDDAKRAGLLRDKSPWTTDPKTMLMARALGKGSRALTPEIYYFPGTCAGFDR